MSVISNVVTTPKKYIKSTQDHICRLCVKKTDRFCKVFSMTGIKNKLAEKIFKITLIVVEESDQITFKKHVKIVTTIIAHTELNRLIAEQFDTSKSLKKRKNSSVLISGSYEELVNFIISKVRDELVKDTPIL